MPRRMKAYLPSWMLWVMLPMLLLIWAFITWSAFGTAQGREELGLIGWLVVSAILVLVGGMFWFMGTGRLPAYILEVEDDEPTPR